MSFANPTPLRVGMSGKLGGRRYRVAGRVVMGMDDGGETYYWNEFNLMNDGGESATLVYEETERGGEWRLFTLFEPEFPMTAEDAGTKRVGDQLNLEGQDVRVTLVDETRVYHIEGEAPEGVELGDVAHYFNAEAGNRMVVVSWTGVEVEYYRGVTISAGMITSAFNLRSGQLSHLFRLAGGRLLSSTSGSSGDGAKLGRGAFAKLAGVVLLFAIIITGYASWRSGGTRATISKMHAPPAPLTLGSVGTLDGKTYRIQGHALVEIAQVGRRYDRHEYQLLDDEENRSLLIYGLKPGDKDWFLFTPLHPLEPLTPAQAAALRVGDLVSLDGYTTTVAELFQSELRQTEGADLPGLMRGTIFFNFRTQSGATPMLVRWNDREISFYRGNLFAAKEVEAAFSLKAGK